MTVREAAKKKIVMNCLKVDLFQDQLDSPIDWRSCVLKIGSKDGTLYRRKDGNDAFFWKS